MYLFHLKKTISLTQPLRYFTVSFECLLPTYEDYSVPDFLSVTTDDCQNSTNALTLTRKVKPNSKSRRCTFRSCYSKMSVVYSYSLFVYFCYTACIFLLYIFYTICLFSFNHHLSLLSKTFLFVSVLPTSTHSLSAFSHSCPLIPLNIHTY